MGQSPKDRIDTLWYDVETWRFIAFVVIGISFGLFVMANSTIDQTIETINDCRLDNYKLKHPVVNEWALNTSQMEGFKWDFEEK